MLSPTWNINEGCISVVKVTVASGKTYETLMRNRPKLSFITNAVKSDYFESAALNQC